MMVETSVAEVGDAFAELIQGARAAAKRHGHFHAFTKVESLEPRLRRELRVSAAKIPHHAAEIASQRRNGCVIANVEYRELLGQVIPVGRGQRPLREIVGKAFREEVVEFQGLKGVMKNGGIAAMFETRQQFREGTRRLIPDPGQKGSGDEIEGCFGDVQSQQPSSCLDAPAPDWLVQDRAHATKPRVWRNYYTSARSAISMRISVRSESKCAAQR